MIPKEITRQHILFAISELKENGIPDFRKSKKYHLQFERNLYPPKLLVSIANKFTNNHELESGTFGGGAETNSFLEFLGFEIIELSSSKGQTKQNVNPRKKLRHTERCKDCKRNIVLLLTHLFGDVIENHQINIGPRPEDFSSHPEYAALKKIFKALGEFRGNKDFIKINKLPRVDYFIKSQNCIIEFDESQHFTQCRKITLENYPDSLDVNFNKEKWKELCAQYNSTDNSPVYRDEQRAWYDTLRDFVPNIFGLKPTIRLHAADEKWCELNPHIGEDMEKIIDHLGISGIGPRKEIKVAVHQSPAPKIARIILSSDWKSDLNEAKEVLKTVCANWPQDQSVDFLITPGAFLGFDIPQELLRDLDNKEPSMLVQTRLFNLAEDICKELLDGELINKLSNYTRYISLGVDSFKLKVSLSYVKIKKPHAELVGMYDLKEGVFYWTGKSFPTVGQQKGLIRISDLGSHFMQTEFGKVMVLGCHDLIIYSPRGKGSTKNNWRKNIRSEFKKQAIEEKPEIVLHHPHNSDSFRTWTASWNELKRDLPTVRLYAGAGKYFRSEGKQRSSIEKVLQKNELGSMLNFIVKNYYKT